VGLGLETGAHRTMPVVGLAYSPFLFWDGRKDAHGRKPRAHLRMLPNMEAIAWRLPI